MTRHLPWRPIWAREGMRQKENPARGGVLHIVLSPQDQTFFSFRLTGIQMRLLVR